MDLSFSDSERAFQQEVRAWFAANTPEYLRRKVVTGQMLNKDDIVRWQRRLPALQECPALSELRLQGRGPGVPALAQVAP